MKSWQPSYEVQMLLGKVSELLNPTNDPFGHKLIAVVVGAGNVETLESKVSIALNPSIEETGLPDAHAMALGIIIRAAQGLQREMLGVPEPAVTPEGSVN